MQRAEALGLQISIKPTADCNDLVPGEISVEPVDLQLPAIAGELNKANAAYVIDTLHEAVTGTLAGQYSGIVTGPVHKGIINDSGLAFSGHTEYFAEHCGDVKPVMMLAAGTLRVALATTHLPLRDVADAINSKDLSEVITILDHDLRERFGIASPNILVCGLNPHAGEGGHLGMEEIETIEPVLQQLREKGLNLTGPIPADTAFTPRYLEKADAVLAMYHDQGLPVLKHAGFGEAVNITLGLPIIRTSVDHGTALDLAGTGKAETGSLKVALEQAEQLAQ